MGRRNELWKEVREERMDTRKEGRNGARKGMMLEVRMEKIQWK